MINGAAAQSTNLISFQSALQNGLIDWNSVVEELGGIDGDWLVGLVVFDLWVNGGGTPQCSAKRRQTNQNQPIDLEFLSLGWNEMESNKEMEWGAMEWRQFSLMNE